MRRIDFIYFDLGNVVLNFSHELACRQISELTSLSPESIWRIAFETNLVVDYELGRINNEQFHARFCQAAGVEVGLAEFLLAFSDIFSFNESIIALVKELIQVNVPIGILSNTCQAHWDFAVQNFPQLGEYFSIHVRSFIEGSSKPDRQIYLAAIEQANATANRIFFVDDRPENVSGAIAVGIDAVIYQSAAELRNELIQRGVLPNSPADVVG